VPLLSTRTLCPLCNQELNPTEFLTCGQHNVTKVRYWTGEYCSAVRLSSSLSAAVTLYVEKYIVF
jgi:hypothetical protein